MQKLILKERVAKKGESFLAFNLIFLEVELTLGGTLSFLVGVVVEAGNRCFVRMFKKGFVV